MNNLTKAEEKQLSRIYSQACADIFMRSAPNAKALERRKAAVKAKGYSDIIQFL